MSCDNIALDIERLLNYTESRGISHPMDKPYLRNRLLEALAIPSPAILKKEATSQSALPILARLCDHAVRIGLIEDTPTRRALFDDRLMGILTPLPSHINDLFNKRWDVRGIKDATNWYYRFNQDINYIRTADIARNVQWEHTSPWGSLTITINLSKPEKDPRDIAKAAAPSPGSKKYPACMLCLENTGFPGRIDYPGRNTLRPIEIKLGGEPWHFQYSPYVYYNEHCIVFSHEHTPMNTDRDTFVRMFEFISDFPHYFLGANAGKPVVGGSILDHDHYQGGCHVMPMEKAPTLIPLTCNIPGITAEIIDWPMSVLRLSCSSREALVDAGAMVLDRWINWKDKQSNILPYTGAEGHNAITPIGRLRDGVYQLDLVLRNNRLDAEHPDGIFHVNPSRFNIKKENIGLIEVMGLFILPGRLQAEMDQVALMLTGEDIIVPPIHAAFADNLATHYGISLDMETARQVIRQAIGNTCEQVLMDCAVFKDSTEGRTGFLKFCKACGLTP